MRSLRYIFAILLVVALAASGFLSYLLFAPVTASNVEFRLVSICRLGTSVLRLNETARLELQDLKKGSCGCLSTKLIEGTGPELAAKLTEGARRLGVFGIKHKWNAEPEADKSGGGLLSGSGLKEKAIEEFSQRYVSAANACGSATGIM